MGAALAAGVGAALAAAFDAGFAAALGAAFLGSSFLAAGLGAGAAFLTGAGAAFLAGGGAALPLPTGATAFLVSPSPLKKAVAAMTPWAAGARRRVGSGRAASEQRLRCACEAPTDGSAALPVAQRTQRHDGHDRGLALGQGRSALLLGRLLVELGQGHGGEAGQRDRGVDVALRLLVRRLRVPHSLSTRRCATALSPARTSVARLSAEVVN